MTNYRIGLTFLMITLALGALTPQFAQEVPKDSETSDQPSALHSLMAGFVRTINTAEVTFHAERGTYGSWQTLLANQEQYLQG
jgi:hypothetical protein